ncbi:MAG: thiamine-phosphate kinase [Thaumarchaeota archaeon]|nr:thiamine-phosphate kinase [Nitrososphaerota archaeon]
MNNDEVLDEESIIKILWGQFGDKQKADPFEDDAAWMPNLKTKRLVVTKADMLVAVTDAPPQMTPTQLARKSVVSCVSDFSAKGVQPKYCTISLGLPKECASREYIVSLAEGFSLAETEYGLRIVGGDTNVTKGDLVVDCSIIGFTDKIVPRNGAKKGDLVGVSGSFGYPPAGLILLSGRGKSREKSFEKIAIDSVLVPKARLSLGLKAAQYLSSCIDSSDGLAISLYHLVESSKVDFELDELPTTREVIEFANENKLSSEDLTLFGGEEYELVCTYPKKYGTILSKLGINTIGRVVPKKNDKPEVFLKSEIVPRKGWIHFRSEESLI